MSSLRTAMKIISPSRVAVVLGALAAALLVLPAADAEARDREVKTKGDLRMVPNALLQSTQRFSPGRISINSGDTLTLTHDDRTQDPHSLTIANENELPTNVDETFNCGAPGTICGDAFEQLPQEDFTFFDAPGTAPGIDGRLDTLWVDPGESASAVVSAPPGTELFFVCALHAWMQGEIRVR